MKKQRKRIQPSTLWAVALPAGFTGEIMTVASMEYAPITAVKLFAAVFFLAICGFCTRRLNRAMRIEARRKSSCILTVSTCSRSDPKPNVAA